MNALNSVNDKGKLFILMALMLCGVAVFAYKPQMEKIKAKQKEYRNAVAKVEKERKLISESKSWEAKYEKSAALMPVFSAEQAVDTHWLGVMDSLAVSNHVEIAKRQVGKEIEVGDVFEFPVDCKDWEATLKSTVDFLWALNAAGAMLDIRQLYIRPINNKPGYLRGQFTLNCAYMRD
jgi:hypothetical protein